MKIERKSLRSSKTEEPCSMIVDPTASLDNFIAFGSLKFINELVKESPIDAFDSQKKQFTHSGIT